VVAVAIFLSRIAGLVRERVFAHCFGNGVAADAFKAALRIPNLLQNLFGEGVLSGSFIPVYARLRAEGRDEDAQRTASVVLALLALLVSVLVLLGVLATPWLIDAIAPGFDGDKRLAAIRYVRILFPGTGLLVLSAWCLGVLNSHRRFFLSYVAPVVWNLAQVAVLLATERRWQGYELATWAAWGAVLGSALQFGVQLPLALRLLGGLRPAARAVAEPVREILHNLGPVFLGRGVVQLSAYIDSMLASWLPSGAVAALAYAQILYTLPISLFGMAISAAELPEMSSALGAVEAVHTQLRSRLSAALGRITFFIVPSAVAFLVLGDVLAALLFQTGRFTRQDAIYVWMILGGATVGLASATMGRLYASTFYALRDTRTPLRFAVLRLALTGGLGALCALWVPGWLGLARTWGAAGLTLSAGVAGWVEFLLLRRALHRRIGRVPRAWSPLARTWLAALAAAGAAWGLRWAAGSVSPDWVLHPVASGVVLIGAYGVVYLVMAGLLRLELAASLLQSLRRRLGAAPRRS